MSRTVAALLAITILAVTLAGSDGGPASWQNIRQLTAGQKIEVAKRDGESLQGTFLGVSDESISLRRKQQDVSVPRADVSRVRAHADRRRRNTWIGAAIGGVGGLIAGGLLGARLANESAGDLSYVKPAAMGGSAAVGALIGALIGSAVGGRYATIYRAK